MEENQNDLNFELPGITRSCYKYNKTIDNRVESCDTLINKENSCFAIWEFNDIDRIIGKLPLNLTEIAQSSKLSLKGKQILRLFGIRTNRQRNLFLPKKAASPASIRRTITAVSNQSQSTR